MNTITLDTMYKPTDVLAYLYPSAGNPTFENKVPEVFENTVSARVLTLFNNRKNLVFANACSKEIIELLSACNVSISLGNSIPLHIDQRLKGQKRERGVIQSIIDLFDKGTISSKTLVGGQPISGMPNDLYSIDPVITTRLNNKSNLNLWVPAHYLPETYLVVENGEKLQEVTSGNIVYPCRAKIACSSAGDGVRLIANPSDLQKIKSEWKNIGMSITFQENIVAEQDIGVYFGLSPEGVGTIYGKVLPNTDIQGASYGATITNQLQDIDPIIRQMFEDFIFPLLREKGQYGIGSIDMLKDTKSGRWKIVDPNFRLSANTGFLLDKLNGNIGDKNIMSFMGVFEGNRSSFEKKIIPLTNEKLIRVLALSKDHSLGKEQYIINGGVLYDQVETLNKNTNELISRTGIQSGAFNVL